MHLFMYCICFPLMCHTFNCAVASIVFTTNGDNAAGSEFTITATVNISEIVHVQAINVTWLDSSESEQSNTIEVVSSGMSELNPSGPVVSTLDLAFSSLLLSQAGVYTLVVTITDTGMNTVTIQRTYQVTVQGKCNCLSVICSV